MATVEDILLPDIGDFSSIEIIEILVAVGDQIQPEQSLLTLESDKATMEIPSPKGGTVKELKVKVGERISEGDPVLTLESSEQTSQEDADQPPSAAQEPPQPPTQEPQRTTRGAQASASESTQRAPGEAERRPAPVALRPKDMEVITKGRKAHASPALRRLARELGVDLTRVKGSGPKGRIVKEDVQGFVKQALAQGRTGDSVSPQPLGLAPQPEVDFTRFGEISLEELPRIRKLSGKHLHRCWLGIPHVTHFDTADITELEAFRQANKDTAARDGVKLTLLPFLLKAVATALNQMPILKASLSSDAEQIIHKHFTHIGVAMDTPRGLLVPVLRDVDKKGLYDLAGELSELSTKARDGKLQSEEMQGGCFTISSLGAIGGTAFTPIINAPEVAILGVTKSALQPLWNGTEFLPRLMLPLSLSFDHRIIDGADAARFVVLLSRLLSDIRRLLL